MSSRAQGAPRTSKNREFIEPQPVRPCELLKNVQLTQLTDSLPTV